MSSKIGRPANKGSFKKGNQVTLGREKSMSLSAMVESALDTIVPTTVKEWDEVRTYRMAIAERLLVTAVATEKADTALSYIKEIMDRTEGKAMQRNQNTNLNVNIDVIAD